MRKPREQQATSSTILQLHNVVTSVRDISLNNSRDLKINYPQRN